MAIFFIFMVNLLSFSAWDSYPTTIQQNTANEWIHYLIDLFLKQKWYSIFSILFGIGFAIQFENIRKKGKKVSAVFSRRMLGLLMLGSLHLFFLWVGDILSLYALLGFVLLLFQNTKNKTLLIWAVVMAFLPLLHFYVMQASNYFYPFRLYEQFNSYFPAGYHPVHTRYYTNSWTEYWYINTKLPWARLAQFLLDGRFFKVFSCFLLGLYMGRLILREKLLENQSLAVKIVLWGGLVGLIMNLIPLHFKVGYLGAFLCDALGVIPMALAYFFGFALLFIQYPRIFSPFIPVGKMALSNYILQSFFGILFFCYIGWSWVGKLELGGIMLIGLVFYVFQLLLSKFWLLYFRFGPLEWLWRCWTYGKWLGIKKRF